MERGISQTAGAVQQQVERGKERDFRAEQADKQRKFQSDEAVKDRVFKSGEAAQARQQQQGQFDASQQQRQAEMQQRGELSREQMDLRAAEQGLQRNPALDQRSQKLDAEMQRGEQQMGAPSELDGQRFIPTEQAAGDTQRELDIKEMRARTEQSRVEIMRQNAITRARNAGRKGDEEGYKAAKSDYASHVKKLGERAERIIKANSGDPRAQVSQDDVNYVRKLAANNPDPELQAEIESGKLGPASARFLRGRMIYDSLDFVAERGDWPDQDSIDEAHPIYQQFQSEVVRAGQLLKQRQQVGAIAGVTNLADANRMKRRIAAVVMKEKARRQRESARSGGQNEQLGGPAAGGQPGGQPGGVQVTPVPRPELNLELPPPPATLGGR